MKKITFKNINIDFKIKISFADKNNSTFLKNELSSNSGIIKNSFNDLDNDNLKMLFDNYIYGDNKEFKSEFFK